MHAEDYVLLIELRDVYDGWSVGVDKEGRMHNRWLPEDGRRYNLTQDFINLNGGVLKNE